MNAALASLFTKANRGNAEVTILELFSILELPDTEATLAKVMGLPSILQAMGLKLIPPIDQGELNSVRRVVFVDDEFITPEIARSEFKAYETDSLELKSSLLFDHKKAIAVPGLEPMAYRSEEVLNSTLKTIAAFLNTSGGLLFIGVDDSGTPIGIQHDFPCISSDPEKQNQDGWELSFRDLVLARFREGGMVNDYLQCKVLEIESLPIARIKVSPRRKLSFVQFKGENSCSLFRRQGNRTFQVKFEDVEEFIELRKDFLQ